MRIKTLVSGLTAVLVLGTSLPAWSANLPKAGAICKKVGQAKIYKEKKFTCVKSGKKFVWDKGVAVTSAKEQAAPAPIASPTPSQTGPTAPITFDNLDLKWTSVVARQNLLSEFAALSQPNSTANFRIGPNVREDLLSEEKRLLAIAERMFSGYFLPSSFEILVYSEKDGDWAEKEKDQLVDPGGWSISRDIANNPYGCNFAGATRTKTNLPMYHMCLDSKGRSVEDKQTTIHEYFHLVQQKYALEKMTCWLVEGSATYFGVALGVDGSDPTGVSSQRFLNSLANQYNPGGSGTRGSAAALRAKIASDSGAVEVLKDLDVRPGNCLPFAAYAVGAIATEALIAVKGYRTYMDFISTFAVSVDWRSEFAKYYGITSDEFYLKLAPYLRGRLSG